MLPPDLDPALPVASNAVEPAEVVRAFERCWSGPGPAPSVRACALDYMRWWPEQELVATFNLTLDASSPPPGMTVISVSARPGGVEYTPLSQDKGLPGLAHAADPAAMASLFEDALRRRIDACTITPVRYRPRRRCVLRYEVSGGGKDETLYGKLLPREEAATLAKVLTALDGVVAPVTAAAPQWGLIVQADTGGGSLSRVGKSAITESDRDAVTTAAALLARVHGSALHADVRTLHDDATALLDFLPACERFAPALAARLRDAPGVVSALPGLSATVPSHGAFRLDQVHITERGPLLIDVDSFCAAEPERDIGNLFAYLTWRAIRHPELRAALDGVRTAFLASYERGSGKTIDAERLRAYQAVSLLKIAGRRYPRLKSAEWSRVPQLVDAAFDLLSPAPVAP